MQLSSTEAMAKRLGASGPQKRQRDQVGFDVEEGHRCKRNEIDPLGRADEAQVNPHGSGGTQPSLFRLSGLADIAHRAMFTSRIPVQ